MKNPKKTLFFVLVLLSGIVFLLNGCLVSDSPSAAVKKGFAAAKVATKTGKSGDWSKFDKYSIRDPSSNGDQAMVKATFEKGEDYELKLIKHDGKWKIFFESVL